MHGEPHGLMLVPSFVNQAQVVHLLLSKLAKRAASHVGGLVNIIQYLSVDHREYHFEFKKKGFASNDDFGSAQVGHLFLHSINFR